MIIAITTLAGMLVIMLAIGIQDLREMIRIERAEFEQVLGHAHKVFPHARPMNVTSKSERIEPLWKVIGR
jgi:hypothetical protein